MIILLISKTAWGILAVIIMLAAYSLQIYQIQNGESEPHPIAWLGFGLLTGLGWIVQLLEGAGAGSWVMGGTAIFCFLIAFLSWYKTRKRKSTSDRYDWAVLGVGIALCLFYMAAKNCSWGPVTAAALATAADLVLYIPILRKAWFEPDKEYGPSYFLNSLKFIPSLFAMANYSFATCLYPSALIVANLIVVVYLWIRKKKSKPNGNS